MDREFDEQLLDVSEAANVIKKKDEIDVQKIREMFALVNEAQDKGVDICRYSEDLRKT